MWKKIQGLGWQKRYTDEAEEEENENEALPDLDVPEEEEETFTTKCKMVSALAFLPPEDVIRGFQALVRHAPEVSDLLSYLEDTYIGKIKNRRGEREKPTYAIPTWNVFERTLKGLHRTNNAAEGTNRAINASFGCAHPTFFKFLKELRRQESITKLKVLEASRGDEKKKKKKVYRNIDRRLLKLTTAYKRNPTPTQRSVESRRQRDARDKEIISYLRSISFNFNY